MDGTKKRRSGADLFLLVPIILIVLPIVLVICILPCVRKFGTFRCCYMLLRSQYGISLQQFAAALCDLFFDCQEQTYHSCKHVQCLSTQTVTLLRLRPIAWWWLLPVFAATCSNPESSSCHQLCNALFAFRQQWLANTSSVAGCVVFFSLYNSFQPSLCASSTECRTFAKKGLLPSL